MYWKDTKHVADYVIIVAGREGSLVASADWQNSVTYKVKGHAQEEW